MSYSTVRLCAGGGGFEAVPSPRHPIDLGEARRRLEGAGIPVVDARVMLLCRFDREVTLSRDGRVLIKTRDPEEAARLFAEVCRRLELPCSAPPGGG